MKRFFLLLCVICVLYGLSWAGNLGESTEGKLANPSLAHTAKLDSAKFVFYYPYGNGYVIAYAYPDDDDSLNVVDTTIAGVDLDSIGSHFLKVTYYPHTGGSVIVYGQWVHKTIPKNTEGEIKSWVWYADSATYFDSLSTMGSGNVLQGEAAGLTKEEIVDEFEDRGYGFGSGTFACTVYTKLSTDSSVIPNIHVIAKNTDQTQLLANGHTNANGWTVLGLDSIAGGAYHKFWLMNIEYSFTFPESADVNTNTSIIFYGSAFDYGDPPAGNQCAVYGQLFDSMIDSLNGAVVKAEVFIPPDSVLRYDGHVISPFIVTDTTNVTGRWRLDLTPNSLFTPTGTWYIFTIEKPDPWGGTIVEEDTLTVPELESYKY